MDDKIRVLIVDDILETRESVRKLLQFEADLSVVGHAGSGMEALAMAKEHRPDVVLMDINMPELNGVEATRRLTEQAPEISVVVLSMYSDRRYVAEMFKAGAKGYILKSSVFDDLCRAITTVAERRHYFCSSIAGVIVKDYVTSLSSSEQPVSAQSRRKPWHAPNVLVLIFRQFLQHCRTHARMPTLR